MRPGGRMGGGAQFGFARPGKAVIGIVVTLIACYVIELVLLRSGQRDLISELMLVPASVFEEGKLWQVVTYTFLHKPDSAGHLLNNLIFLIVFAAPLETWWKSRRLLFAYAICILSGGIFTLVVALLSKTMVLSWLVPHFWTGAHMGASGAVMGLTMAWGLTYDQQEMNFLFLGQMKARTFMWIMIGVELLIALSLDDTSSTSHFGGMIGAWVLCRGMWRPSSWGEMWKRSALRRKKRMLEHELRVIDGGGMPPPPPPPPPKKNGGGNGMLN